jgi:hypothetical protein
MSELVQVIAVDLGMSILGFKKDPFGGAMITSVASLGINEAWAPLTRIDLNIILWNSFFKGLIYINVGSTSKRGSCCG